MDSIFNFDHGHAIQSRGSGGILISDNSKPRKPTKINLFIYGM